jgi:hypothetical protein
MNEPDPDALIAERLSGHSPFTSTDFAMDAEMPPFAPEGAASEPSPAEAQGDSPHAVVTTAAAGQEHPGTAQAGARSTPHRAPGTEDAFELIEDGFDLESIIGQFESAPGTPHTASGGGEVDVDHRADTAPAPSPGADPDGAFERLRDDAARRVDAADEEYKAGLALLMAGDLEGAIEALKAASRAPKLRFASAALLGRTFMILGMAPEAIEWFEHAAEAPAPAPADSHLLLYELANALESQGEVARALAICLELKAEAGDYKDVRARVDRLAKVQTRG